MMRICTYNVALVLLLSCCSLVLCYHQLSSSFSRIYQRSTCHVPQKHHISPYDIINLPADILSSGMKVEDMKLGVLLLNLGGPEKMQDVEGFLYNLFADPDIIRLPPFLSALQKPLAYVIAKRRAPKSSAAYKAIGGGSPIVQYTSQQASLIAEQLRHRGIDDPKCYFAMRYWHPYTEEVLEEIKHDGINTLVIVPLYPQYSISTSGSSLKLLQNIFSKDTNTWGQAKMLHTVVPAWYYRKGYVQAVTNLIVKDILAIRVMGDPVEPVDVDVLFSAHGVPLSYIQAGDPYQKQIEDCFQLVTSEVRSILAAHHHHAISGVDDKLHFHLSYQSRVGPVAWLKPYTEDTIVALGEQGVKRLVVVPISFVSEHIETLEEIDMEYRELAEFSGVEYWRRVPALNTDEAFINDMADMVIEALESPLLVLSDALSGTSPRPRNTPPSSFPSPLFPMNGFITSYNNNEDKDVREKSLDPQVHDLSTASDQRSHTQANGDYQWEVRYARRPWHNCVGAVLWTYNSSHELR